MGAFLEPRAAGALRAADDREAIKRMPWNVIVMVSGMTVLIALLEKVEGIDLFVSLLASVDTARR